MAGYKYVRLYAPSETPYLYTSATDNDGKTNSNDGHAAGEALGSGAVDETNASASRYERRVNVSGVGNVEKADLVTFPLFANAQYTEAILRPGDSLYMPAGTWHYIRSLSASMSINFWF